MAKNKTKNPSPGNEEIIAETAPVMVSVTALVGMYEGDAHRAKGTVFQVTEERARALRNLVSIVDAPAE